MINSEDAHTVKHLVWGTGIYFLLVSIPVLLLTKDKIKGELGLFIGCVLAVFMVIHMHYTIDKSVYRESNQGWYMAMNSVLRMVICAAVLALSGIFGFANIFTMLIGLFGLKISAYMEPLFNKKQKNKG